MTERLETLHYFEPDPSEPMYCKHCNAEPDEPKAHVQEEQPRKPGRCWCGHVRVSHRPWADGEFCTREGCGCRHYAEKRAGGEVLERFSSSCESGWHRWHEDMTVGSIQPVFRCARCGMRGEIVPTLKTDDELIERRTTTGHQS